MADDETSAGVAAMMTNLLLKAILIVNLETNVTWETRLTHNAKGGRWVAHRVAVTTCVETVTIRLPYSTPYALTIYTNIPPAPHYEMVPGIPGIAEVVTVADFGRLTWNGPTELRSERVLWTAEGGRLGK